nr:hypothetical protein [uncultured Psychroserpens sp.]
MKKLKYFTHFLLLITVLTFTNCQKEELFVEPEQSSNELLFHKTRYAFSDEINQNKLLSETLCGLKEKPLKSKNDPVNRLIYNSNYDFTVETDFAKYIESIDGTYHSYTFPIITADAEDTSLDNLVLFSENGSDYSAKLIKYNLTEDQLNQLTNFDHIDSNLEMEVVDLEGDFNEYLGRLDENSCENEIRVHHLTPDGQSFEFGEGSVCHHQGEMGDDDFCQITVTVIINCPADSSG